MGFNHANLFAAVAAAVPEREAIVHGEQRITYAELASTARRVANLLLEQGIGLHRDRHDLQGWESGQDHVGLYLHNGREYLEATLGANAARAVPFNVNYRYVADELAYLLNDADCAALVYHSAFAPTLTEVLPRLKRQPVLLQVADDSGNALLDGALDWSSAVAAASDAQPPTEPSDDDLYMLYTGGTTGMPKGTLWRQADIYDAAIGSMALRLGGDLSTVSGVAAAAAASPATRALPMPPYMHGAAQWVALGALLAGATVIIQRNTTKLDPADIWETIEREKVEMITFVGDAFARPLIEEYERQPRDASSLIIITTGGAVTSAGVKAKYHELLPTVLIADVGGASETGSQLSNVTMAGSDTTAAAGVFAPQAGSCVIDDAKEHVVSPGHEGLGWLARQGAIPLGYLGDAVKTAATFPVVDGVRMVVPGDRARLRADGMIELLGRESVTINSGGEKIFAEEVEQAIVRHPAVDDVLVVGRPSERWGQEVVAVVELHPGAEVTDDELIESTGDALARYKRPKAIVRVDKVLRSPAGKADYAWARGKATE